MGLWRCWYSSALRCHGFALCSSTAGGGWSAASGRVSSGARARPGVGPGLFSTQLKELDAFLCYLPREGFGVDVFRGPFQRHQFCERAEGLVLLVKGGGQEGAALGAVRQRDGGSALALLRG